MNHQKTETDQLQWHPAFYAGLQVELQEEASQLIFENEHQLGTKPKEIDVLIIKKNARKPIKKNIGRIFRKHNILEYKSPEDYLSIDDYYLVYGYTCFYKSDTPNVDQIKIDQISITFVCSYFPHKLVNHLTKKRKFKIIKQEDGIYHIKGDIFPIQIIVTSRLSKENNFWLSNLSNHVNDKETISKMLTEYQNNRKNTLYQSLMNIIVRANEESFREENGMCQALWDLFEDELTQRMNKEIEIKVNEQCELFAQQVTRQVTQQVTRQEIRNHLQRIMKNAKVTAEEAMDILEIPQADRKLYILYKEESA